MHPLDIYHQIVRAFGLDSNSVSPRQVLQLVLAVFGAVGDQDDAPNPELLDDEDADTELRAQRRPGTKELNMDTDKVLAAVAKALGLEEGAAPEDVQRMLEAVIAFASAKNGGAEEPVAEDAEAAEASVDVAAVAASIDKDALAKILEVVKAATDAQAEPVVEAAVETPEAAVELVDELPVLDDVAIPVDPEAVAGEAALIVANLAELTGLDEASVLTAMNENMDALAAAILGDQGDGVPAEEAGEAGMSAALTAAKAVQASTASKLTKAATENAKLLSRIEKLESDRSEDRIERSAEQGHVDRAAVPALLALARSGNVKELNTLLEAAEKDPAVPTGSVVSGTGSDVTAEGNVEPGSEAANHPEVIKLKAWLKSAKLGNTARGKAQVARLMASIDSGNYGRA